MLVSDIGGLADSVEDGVDGFKVPMRDAEAWAAAMSKLLHEPARSVEMARAGVAKLQREFAEEKWLKRIGVIYDGISQRKA